MGPGRAPGRRGELGRARGDRVVAVAAVAVSEAATGEVLWCGGSAPKSPRARPPEEKEELVAPLRRCPVGLPNGCCAVTRTVAQCGGVAAANTMRVGRARTRGNLSSSSNPGRPTRLYLLLETFHVPAIFIEPRVSSHLAVGGLNNVD